MARLKPGEKCRNVAGIVWMDALADAVGGGDAYAALVGYLAGLHVECACSPVHDRDLYTPDDVRKWRRRHVDPATGKVDPDAVAPHLGRAPEVNDPKKPHVHLLFRFGGPRTPESVTEMMAGLLPMAPTKWERVESVPAYVRYLAHMDNPEKASYAGFEVHGFGGIDLSPLFRTDDVDKLKVAIDVCKVIDEEHMHYFSELNRWAVGTGDPEIISCVMGRTPYFVSVLAGKRSERELARARERRENPRRRSRQVVEKEFSDLVSELFMAVDGDSGGED